MDTQIHVNVTLYVNLLSCFPSFQGALIPSIMNTSKYTRNTILLQTGLSVPTSRRILFSSPLMVSNQHPDASCGITGVASLSTFLPFLSSKPDYSWEIKEQIFKWCHTHRPFLPLPPFLPLSLLSAAHVPDSKDQRLTSNNAPQFKITYVLLYSCYGTSYLLYVRQNI
jgi:hypothetical protein